MRKYLPMYFQNEMCSDNTIEIMVLNSILYFYIIHREYEELFMHPSAVAWFYHQVKLTCRPKVA